MIDIHSHILPGVDDGSEDLSMSLEMLRMAAESGSEAIVATPHCNIPGTYENFADEALSKKMHTLKEEAKESGLPIQILTGMEVYATKELPQIIKDRRVWTLNHTRYLLMEFGFDEDPAFCWQIIEEIKALGVRPVIAHPERYYFLQYDPQIAYEWCTSGCALQLNKGSLLGSFGEEARHTSHALLRHNLAACVASDAHGTYQRNPDMQDARQYVDRMYSPEYGHLLFEVNPRRILKGERLYGYEARPF